MSLYGHTEFCQTTMTALRAWLPYVRHDHGAQGHESCSKQQTVIDSDTFALF